ncbi:hypothetical protein [Gordonia sp. 4N]|uniref:hypothetical protein n=2 Tax=unclassified Gordonia (in: high G+C Gram-positive bacteria) TaxID=2657482 RepID=UPI002248983A|nr:hypothetical protein [Gordonia sp. 4N]MCX2755973.1 hypothetical protein [Gordonia sp. 4N]
MATLAICLIGITGGCEGSIRAEKPSLEMPVDVAWRTVNQNLNELVPVWQVALPFPEQPMTHPEKLHGCSTGKNSLVDGPPWSVRSETNVDYYEPTTRSQVDRGFSVLESRGYKPIEIARKNSADERKVTNDEGFSVVLTRSIVSYGPPWTVTSLSPCITFSGDEQYSQSG